MTILRPIFGRGLARKRSGSEVPELHQKFPLLLGAQSSNLILQKNCLGPPLNPAIDAFIIGTWFCTMQSFDQGLAYCCNRRRHRHGTVGAVGSSITASTSVLLIKHSTGLFNYIIVMLFLSSLSDNGDTIRRLAFSDHKS